MNNVNLRQMTIEEEKQCELDILKHVATFCKENGITYFLAYGTLIGAVRHKGFIPWDDDIDIQMPRADYEKFIKLYKESNSCDRYKIVEPLDSNSKHTFLKVVDSNTVKIEAGLGYSDGYLGVDIDVFPIDGMPSDEKEYARWYKKLYKIYYNFFIKKKSSARSVARTIILYLLKLKLVFVSCEKLLIKAQKLHDKYPYEKCEYVGSMSGFMNGKGNRSKKVNFEEQVLLPFEGEQFFAPKGYDAILTNLYGDYMKLPPEEKQVAHHKNQVYYKEQK